MMFGNVSRFSINWLPLVVAFSVLAIPPGPAPHAAAQDTSPAASDQEVSRLGVSPPTEGSAPQPVDMQSARIKADKKPAAAPGSMQKSQADIAAETLGVDPAKEDGEATPPNRAAGQVANAIQDARSLSRAFRHAAAEALPSVVMILSQIGGEDEEAEDIRSLLETTGNFDSVGSGVIMNSDGLIMTNQHVVRDAKRIRVCLADGRKFNVDEVVGDINSDIAILRIDATDLPAATVGSSDDLFVGDWVLAIGSPFTLQSSVSAGIVSGKDRWHALSKDVRGQFLQVDAAINPGNSGGPLVDLDGKLVGINTAISSRNGGFQGIGFSIPIRRAVWIMEELQEHGRVRRGSAGVQISDVPYSVAESLELPRGVGAYVVRTTPGLPADKAGLKRGDIILSYDGMPIQSSSQVAEFVQRSIVGQPIGMKIRRGDDTLDLKITLRERP